MEKSSVVSRVNSLDVLRGLAIFGMVLSGLHSGGLPDWMYHDQYWVDGKLIVKCGLTWVDLVFPLFLFSMGAAIPMALSRRIEEGKNILLIILQIVFRWLLLAGVAIFIDHNNIWAMSGNPTPWMWLRIILGFICFVALLARWPIKDGKYNWLKYVLRTVAVIGVIVLLVTVKMADGTGFKKERLDIIILILANAYMFGAIFWLVSRKNLTLRLAIIFGIVTVWLNMLSSGWLVNIDAKSFGPLRWLVNLGLMKYSCMTLLGSIIGDKLLEWIKVPTTEKEKGLDLTLNNIVTIIVGLLLLVIGGLTLLQARWILEGFLFTLAICLTIHFLLKNSTTATGELVKKCFYWLEFLLITGFIIEPFQGGVRKDAPTTISYFILTAGLAIALLLFFFIIMEVLNKQKWSWLLRVTGSNPLLAYVMGAQFVYPILHLTGIMNILDKITLSPWLGLIRTILLVILVCLTVNIFTKFKIYIRI